MSTPDADYLVGITFCNSERPLAHHHDEESNAVKEYLEYALAGIEDQEPDSFRRTHQGTRHVRLVSLIRRRGNDRHVYWHVNTGVQPCIHRPE
jgi:hypothetical protein